MKKSKKVQVIKDEACLNCGHPFAGSENFCPECGQANKDKRITLKEFIYEVFNGFFSWDAKFWKTIIPLLTQPGKVSKDYINGKRDRYTNPFRFYLTVSILFFLLVGAVDSFEKFSALKNGTTQIQSRGNSNLQPVPDEEKVLTSLSKTLSEIDSIKNSNKKLKQTKDTISRNRKEYEFLKKVDKFNSYQKEHPETTIESALDSLKEPHTFFNRFLYDRIETLNKIDDDDQSKRDFLQKMISYTSISLFILLPIFTLFLKLFYIRRKYTYVEHLVFVFHTQTVFFLLLTLFFIINYFSANEYIITVFLLLFISYLFMALKKFYSQGYFKTFIKFILINMSFLMLFSFGFLVITAIAFALY